MTTTAVIDCSTSTQTAVVAAVCECSSSTLRQVH